MLNGALIPFVGRHSSSYVGPPFQGWLKLGSNRFSRQNAIEGEVTLNVSYSQETKGVWIELVTLAGAWTSGKEGQVIFKPTDLSPSNPSVALIGSNHPPESADGAPTPDFTLDEGTHKFNFTFKLNGDYTIPATYRSNCGGVEHRLVLVASDGCVSHLDEKTITMPQGYLDLLSRPQVFNTLKIVETKMKSLFSSSVLLQVTLDMPKSGYLPGESINGAIMIENPSGEIVEEALVECIRKIVFYDGRLYKRTTTFLAQDSLILKSTEVLITSDFDFQLPPNMMPTWQSPNGAFKSKYIVQFTVKTVKGTSLKGKTDILIGSHAGDLGPIMESRVSTPIHDNFAFSPSGSQMRRSMESLPPSYSMLSSRRSSVATLPPTYDSVLPQ